MKSVLLVASLVLLLSPADCGNHLVFPVSTDLQRTLLGRPGESLRDAKAYVLINGTAVMSGDGMIDAKALDLAAIREQLATLVDREKGVVCFNVCYNLPSRDREEEFLRLILQGFGRNSGFRDTKVSNSYMSEAFNWDKEIAAVNEKSTAPDADETAIENDVVRVYPVRTTLSRYLTSNADCVVEILQPVGAAGLTPAMREAIQQIAPKANVRTKRVIQFRIWSQQEGRQAVDEFVSMGGAKELAESLGYEQSSVSHTPR